MEKLDSRIVGIEITPEGVFAIRKNDGKNSSVKKKPDEISNFAELKQQLNRIEKALENFKPPEYLTTQEVMKVLKISRKTVSNYEYSGKLKSYKIDGKKMFKKSEINESLIPMFAI